MPKRTITAPASGFTMDYTDPNTGLQLPEAWIQINYISYTPMVNCFVWADAYANQSQYQSGMEPVFRNIAPQALYGGASWNTYFDPSVMDQPNSDIQAMALAYLQYIL